MKHETLQFKYKWEKSRLSSPTLYIVFGKNVTGAADGKLRSYLFQYTLIQFQTYSTVQAKGILLCFCSGINKDTMEGFLFFTQCQYDNGKYPLLITTENVLLPMSVPIINHWKYWEENILQFYQLLSLVIITKV